MWEMSCPWADNLTKRVSKNPELWRNKVKAVTHAEESAARLQEIEATATDDAVAELADLVATSYDAIAELAEMIAEMQA